MEYHNFHLLIQLHLEKIKYKIEKSKIEERKNI